MHNPTELFPPSPNVAALAYFFSQWHLPATPEQLHVHAALTSRTITPDERSLHLAAAWLHTLSRTTKRHPRFETHVLTAALDEKSALIHRLAYAHVPPVAAELERPDSPLHIIDTAARFLPPHPHLPRPTSPRCVNPSPNSISQ